MAYCLRPEERIPDGLRRLAKNELNSAAEHLVRTAHPDDEAIHEARKSLKKVRAIVELVEADGGNGLASSPKRLRTINRALSRLRDVDAMVEIFKKLKSRNRRLFSRGALAGVQRRLSSRKRAVLNAAERKGALRTVLRDIRKVRKDAKWWEPRHRRFGALEAGLRSTYRRGRKAMRRATTSGQAADFHEWRKQIKALWYELRLVQEGGKTMQRDVEALHRAETWLGDDHNIVVLCAELSKSRSIDGAKSDLDALRETANRYQSDLRRRAVAGTRHIYAQGQGVFVRRVKRAWKASRRQVSVRKRV
jgi:CHAD domain-containing protein